MKGGSISFFVFLLFFDCQVWRESEGEKKTREERIVLFFYLVKNVVYF